MLLLFQQSLTPSAIAVLNPEWRLHENLVFLLTYFSRSLTNTIFPIAFDGEGHMYPREPRWAETRPWTRPSSAI